ncbi:hypothetical protein ACIRSU_11870 [Streptomyces sp. NPDC101160]|uniref:hypothetical protein n=1 Tax=Streptomyces sp. NPDC101160 TaxID=3366118 RepID=UPI0037F1B9AB
MRTRTKKRRAGNKGGGARHRLTDAEFRVLSGRPAQRTAAGSCNPPAAETDFALRTQHAEFGAAAH